MIQLVEMILTLLSQDLTSKFRIMCPSPLPDPITIPCLITALRDTVINVMTHYPKKVAPYFIYTSDDRTPYEEMVIAERHSYCLAYKKYIYMAGRNCKLAYHSAYQFQSRDQIKCRLAAVLTQHGIIAEGAFEDAQRKFLALRPGQQMQLYNLIRNKLLWSKGPNIAKIAKYLRRPVSWWFDATALSLPESARPFMFRHMCYYLKSYSRP
jgi:hypothetical protein